MALTKVSGDILDTGIVVAGVTTSTNFKTGTSNLHSAGIEIAGINVLGADTPIGAGVTIYNSGGADFTGVVTATRFVGQADISGGSIIATTGTFSGDVSIGGTLTYQDVTNIDSVGLITARAGIIDSTLTAGRVNYAGANGRLTGSANLTYSSSVLQITKGTSGGATANTDAALIVDNSSHTYIQFRTPATKEQGLLFGDDADNDAGAITYSHSTNALAFTTNANPRLSIDSTGKATFSGDVQIDGDELFIADSIKHVGDTDTLISFPSNDTINFRTAGTERLRIDSDGRLLVGTDVSPASANTLLRVHTPISSSSVNSIEISHNTNGADKAGAALGLAIGNGGASTNAADLYFSTATNGSLTQKLWIRSDGHITPAGAGTQDLGSTSKEFRHLYLGDSGKAFFGLDQDVAIYNATNFHIEKTGTDGSGIRIHVPTNESIEFQQAQATVMATFTANGSCSLYNNTVKRIETSSTGVTVTGEVAASQDYPNYRPTLDFNFAAVKKLDPRITYSRTGPASYVDEFGKVVLVGDNVPRFDHDPTTRESKGLLLEETRTNMIIYSTDYTQSSLYQFSSYEGAISENLGTAPDGGLTDAFIGEGNTGRHTLYIKVGTSLSNSTKYSMSIFVKRVSDHSNERYCRLETANYSSWTHAGASATFDLSNGTEVTSASTNITSGIETYPDGWFRIHFETTTGTVVAGTGFYLNITNSSGSSSSTTLTSSQGLFVYGTQMEAGAFITSYIPTSGSTATRGVDTVEIEDQEFTEFYNQTEGTLMVNGYTPPITLAVSPSTKNSISLRGESQILHSIRYVTHASSATNRYVDAYQLLANGSNVVDHGGSNGIAIEDRYYKHITTFKKDDYAYTYGGASQVWTDASGDLPEMNRLIIGEDPTQFFLKRVVYYPKRLPNSQLTTLVS